MKRWAVANGRETEPGNPTVSAEERQRSIRRAGTATGGPCRNERQGKEESHFEVGDTYHLPFDVIPN